VGSIPTRPTSRCFAPTADTIPASVERSADKRNHSPISLKIQFQLVLDREREDLTTYSSMFGWCVRPTSAYCPLRVEYEREKANYSPSHVQVDGESSGWAYGMGLLGRDISRLDKLHLPFGSRRFRPSLEDFIEFLIQQKWFPATTTRGSRQSLRVVHALRCEG
jgi:hypothetical protein